MAFNEVTSAFNSFNSDCSCCLERRVATVSDRFCTAAETSPTKQVRFLFISSTVSARVFFFLWANKNGSMNRLKRTKEKIIRFPFVLIVYFVIKTKLHFYLLPVQIMKAVRSSCYKD